MLKWILRTILTRIYRVQIEGLPHLQERLSAGRRVLVVANHTSFLDALLLAVFLPGRFTFAVNTQIARKWWIRPLVGFVRLFPMDPTNPLAIRALIGHLKDGHPTVIFPEGRITVTGSLMKTYAGPGLVADKTGADVIPVRIDGAQYTPFSRLRGQIRLRWFPQISLTVLPARTLNPPEQMTGRARRDHAGAMLAELMTEMMFATTETRKTVFDTLVGAARTHGFKQVVLEDVERNPIHYRTLFARAFMLGDRMAQGTEQAQRVGLMLPNTVSTVVAFLGLQLHGRVPAMLNFSAGPQAIVSAATTATLKRVYTSRRFVESARLQPIVALLEAELEVIYLEDLREQIGPLQWLQGQLCARFPAWSYRTRRGEVAPDSPAVVLFTSGSEGAPKGVVLSHANLLANQAQLAARVDFSAKDVILNALPMFHSFGLTAGTLLPLASGIRVFQYPSPLHFRIVPEIAYDINATILFGTNTFLAGYARFAHPYDFYSVRYIFAGAEKLQEQTRRQWADKFGVRILEGYGATETSPALSTNTPMAYRAGTVGRLLPGIQHRLVPVEGIEEGGRLEVSGPNIMLGYLRPEQPGVIEPPRTEAGPGWYDTGDIVAFDQDGYLRMCGRAKRFAKIAGEMVSLTAAEQLAAEVWPTAQHAVVAIPDAAKGEQLVLVTEQADAKRPPLVTRAKQSGVGELTVPRTIHPVEKVPLLGTGKVDYPATLALVMGDGNE